MLARISCCALLFGAFFVFLPSPNLFAETPLTFSEVIAELDSTSPVLADARAELEIARAEYESSRGFPNPALVGSQESLNDDANSTERSIGVSQNLGFLWTHSSGQAAAKARARAAAASYTGIKHQLLVEILAQSLDYDRLRAQSEILDSVLARAFELTTAAAARHAEGDISSFDEQRIVLERIQLENQKQELEQEKSAILSELVRLTGLDANQLIALSPNSVREVSFNSLDEALDYAQAHRAENTRSQESLKAAKQSLAKARRNQLPDFTVGIGSKQLDPGSSGFYIEGELEIPLWSQRRGEKHAALAQVQRAQVEQTALLSSIRQEVESAYAQYLRVRDSQALLESAQANGASENMNRGVQLYLADEISALELVDALRTGIEAHDAITRLQNSLTLARAELRRACGLDPLEN